MRLALVMVVVACGGGRGEREPERAPLDPAPAVAAEAVRVELAWVVSAAPTEVKEVECKLVLRVIRPGGDEKGEIHELGTWWRAQQGVIEMVEVTSAGGPMLFRTEAAFGTDGDLTKAPAFEVVREPGGAVVVRGKDEDTPWRQIERVEIPAATPVEGQRPQP